MADQVQIMRRLVHQYTAALAFPRAPPAAAKVVGRRAHPGEDAGHSLDAAQLPAVDQPFHRPHVRQLAVLVVDRQHAVVGPRRRDHRVRIFDLDGDRFFHQHMAAGVERVDRDRRVKRMGRDDHRHIRLGLGQHLPVVGIEGAAPLLGPLLARLRRHVRAADHLYLIEAKPH